MDIISVRDMKKDTIDEILSLAEKIEKDPDKYVYKKEKVIGTLFFEPSTRTKLSFQSATARLGMEYIDFMKEVSSMKKGESFTDTIRTVDGYVDGIVIRHKNEGSARLAADVAEHPVVNGGDGGNQHPTQGLIDLYTIKKLKNKIRGLNITLNGDLKHARTMQSLIYMLGMYGANVTLISPRGLEMDQALVEEVKSKFGTQITQKNEVDFKDADVVYMCRIQKERFADPYEAMSIQRKFSISLENLKDAKDDMVILHPLPKVNEIDYRIDHTKYAKYFEQAHNGIPVRMAVLKYVLEH